MPLDVNSKVNINKFYDVARTDIASLISGAAIDSAVIFNDGGKPVKFYVYNYIDTIFLVSAQKTLVASDHYGQVAASGKFFKIHPDDDKDAEFLVAPGKAYVYRGPGKIETVES